MATQVFKELFNGPYDGVTPATLLPMGAISDGQNLRRVSPQGGWKARKGVTAHNTTAIAAASVLSLHKYKHAYEADYHFIAQCNGNLYDASSDPPTAGTTFAASALTSLASSSQPGFSDIVGEYFVYADGSGRPVVWGGDFSRAFGFITSDNDEEVDASRVVSDGRADTYAAIPNVAADDCFYFCSPEIATGARLKFIASAINSNAATLTVSAWRSAAWADVSDLSDGTADEGATLAKDGTVSWTVGSDEMRVICGIMGYWYKVTWSADLSTGIQIASCDIVFSPARMTNKWNGAFEFPLAVRFYDESAGTYEDYTGKLLVESTSVYLDLNAATTSDFVYIKTAIPATGFGFGVVDETGNTADAQIDDIEVWTDAGWTSVSNIVDETLDATGDSSFYQTGTVWFDGSEVTPRRKKMSFDATAGYWYRVSWDASLSETDIFIYLATVAYFPEELPAYDGCIEFKGRTFLWGDPEYPNRLRYSSVIRPDCFAGNDSGYTAPFGNDSKILACHRFYNELLVLKEDSIWLLEGYSPDTFGILKLTDKTGVVGPKASCVVEAGSSVMKADEALTVVPVVTHDGLYLIDGRKPRKVTGPVAHYFDSEYSTCIEATKLDDIQVFADRVRNEVHILVPYSGTQAAFELVYNYVYNEWYPPWKRTVGAAASYLVCGVEILGSDGRYYCYGGNSAGVVYLLEDDTSDKDASNADVAIIHYLKTRAISFDQKLPTTLSFTFLKVILEAKQCVTTGTLTTTFFKNLITSGTALATPAALTLAKSGYSLVTDGLVTNQVDCSCFQLKFEAATIDLELEAWAILYSIDLKGEIIV
jgi:hypothetical protein